VYDATAKVPSGLLNGNINQFGDFDECIGVEGKSGIRGQYCLAYLQLDVNQSRPDLKYLHRLLHSHYAFRSNMTDVSICTFLCVREFFLAGSIVLQSITAFYRNISPSRMKLAIALARRITSLSHI